MKLVYPWLCVAGAVLVGLLGVPPLIEKFPIHAQGSKGAAAAAIYLLGAALGLLAAYLEWRARFELAPEQNRVAVIFFQRGIAGALGLLLAILFLVLAAIALT